MSELCPIECIYAATQEPDFLEKNGAWLLTVIAGCTGCVGMVLTYFLKSRCSRINFCGISCVREVLSLKPSEVVITSSDTA